MISVVVKGELSWFLDVAVVVGVVVAVGVLVAAAVAAVVVVAIVAVVPEMLVLWPVVAKKTSTLSLLFSIEV